MIINILKNILNKNMIILNLLIKLIMIWILKTFRVKFKNRIKTKIWLIKDINIQLIIIIKVRKILYKHFK